MVLSGQWYIFCIEKYYIMDQLSLLEKIKEVSKKQCDKRPIGVDTLTLISGMRAADLEPLLSDLANDGYIEFHTPLTSSMRPSKCGSVTLLPDKII
jgi:hypothetical protein